MQPVVQNRRRGRPPGRKAAAAGQVELQDSAEVTNFEVYS